MKNYKIDKDYRGEYIVATIIAILMFLFLCFWCNNGNQTYDDYIDYETGTIVSVRGIFDTTYIVKLDTSGDRIYVHSFSPYIEGDNVILKNLNGVYFFSTENEMTEFYKNKSGKIMIKSPSTYLEDINEDINELMTEIQEQTLQN